MFYDLIFYVFYSSFLRNTSIARSARSMYSRKKTIILSGTDLTPSTLTSISYSFKLIFIKFNLFKTFCNYLGFSYYNYMYEMFTCF